VPEGRKGGEASFGGDGPCLKESFLIIESIEEVFGVPIENSSMLEGFEGDPTV
jgi:hypothetical protein